MDYIWKAFLGEWDRTLEEKKGKTEGKKEKRIAGQYAVKVPTVFYTF